MQNLNFLTDDDVQVLKEMLAWRKSQYVNARIRTSHVPLQDQTPDVYIAWTEDGIPAMTGPAENETGTSSGIYDGDLNMPGEGLCTIFRVLRISPTGTSTSSGSTEDLPLPALYPIGKSPITVLNISGEEIRPLQFIVVNRDKFGNWIAQQPQSGSIGPPGPPGPGESLEIVGGSEGSGSISGVTKATFDYCDVTGTTPNCTITMIDASYNDYGVMNTTTQTFAGVKTFATNVSLTSGDIFVSTFEIKSATTGNPSQCSMGYGGLGGTGFLISEDATGGNYIDNGITFFLPYTNAQAFLSATAGNQGFFAIGLFGGASSIAPAPSTIYSIADATGAQKFGKTGTGGGGDTVIGGIITTLGTGGFAANVRAGQSTVIAGNTSVTVTMSSTVGTTSYAVIATPTSIIAVAYYVTVISATQFSITLASSLLANVTFNWEAVVNQ